MNIVIDKDMMDKLHNGEEVVVDVDGMEHRISFEESADQESNPAYFKGLSKKDKEERERVIKKRSKMKNE